MATITSIRKLLCQEECEKILNRSLDFPAQLVSYKIEKFHDGVAGFLGDHLNLTIYYTSGNSPGQATYFIKALPQFNLNQLNYVKEAGIFKKEVILYQNLLSELINIGQFGPRAYLIKENCIVLEDLKAKGFRMLSKHNTLDQKHTYALLKTLARYHASTIIYEKKNGVKLDQNFKDEIKETCFSFVEGQPRQKWCVSTTKCVSDIMKLVSAPHNIEEIRVRFSRFVFEELPLLIAPSKRFRNVLVHDDLWCNNLLFNDRSECVFVDFQLVRYTPSALDFLTSLFLNTDYIYVENNINKLIDIYCSFFEEELRKHNLDINHELPRKEFEESLSVYKMAALTETAMYATHIYISDALSNHIVADFDNYNEFSFINRSKFAVKEFEDNAQYRERLCRIMRPLIKTLAMNVH